MASILRLAAVAALAATAAAQTWTNCNPLNTTCPPNLALGTYAQFDWTANHLNPNVWNSTGSKPVGFGKNGSEFVIDKQGDAPTINTNFAIFFGSVSVVMKAAPGRGICSSVVLLSDDLDEIDWEILGGNRTHIQSNYFGKGNDSTFDRGAYHQVDWAPQDEFHNYTFDWTKERIQWIIDGKVYRELKYEQAQGGKYYPQTPSRIHLGSWAAGDPRNRQGTIEWAGGVTDFKKGPYEMNIKTVYIQDASTGSKYTWTDKTGSWQSIQAEAGTSKIVPELNKVYGAKAHWNSFPQGTKIAIIASSIGAFVIIVAAVIWCCIRSTRKGLKEHAAAEAVWEQQQKEANDWRRIYNEQHRTSSFNSTSTRAYSSNGMMK